MFEQCTARRTPQKLRHTLQLGVKQMIHPALSALGYKIFFATDAYSRYGFTLNEDKFLLVTSNDVRPQAPLLCHQQVRAVISQINQRWDSRKIEVPGSDIFGVIADVTKFKGESLLELVGIGVARLL